MTRARISLIAAVAAALLACADKKKSAEKGDNSPAAKPSETTSGTTAEPGNPVGVEKVSDLSYVWGKGSKAYNAATKAAGAKDWDAAVTSCREALAADPGHLDAHRLLAAALAQKGQPAEAAEHLEIALTADWLAWGPTLTTDPNLEPLWKSPEGAAARELSERLGNETVHRVRDGALFLGRRTVFKFPAKTGRRWGTTRAELMAYDIETGRYLRVTHTGEKVAGWLRSPSGEEIAYVTFSEIIRSADGESAPLIGKVRIGLIDTETFTVRGQEARLKGDAETITLQYLVGDELAVRVSAGDSDKVVGYVVDKAAGKLKKSARGEDTSDHAELRVSVVTTTLVPPRASGIRAHELASDFVIEASDKQVKLGTGEKVSLDGFDWSPDKSRLLVRTAADPCGASPEASLYLVDAATGRLKHIFRGNSTLATEWIDNDTFIYEHDDGGLRVHDGARNSQIAELKERGRFGIYGVGATAGNVCTEAPLPTGEGEDDWVEAPDEEEPEEEPDEMPEEVPPGGGD